MGCASDERRKRQIEAVTNLEVIDLLGGVTVTEFASNVRGYLKAALGNLTEDILPTFHTQSLSKTDVPSRFGTGLPKVYRNLEYRIERSATFELTDDACHAVAIMRSIEKLSCADWAEQGSRHARSMAMRVRAMV